MRCRRQKLAQKRQGRCRDTEALRLLILGDIAGAGIGTDTSVKIGVSLDGSPTPFRLTFSKYPCVQLASTLVM